MPSDKKPNTYPAEFFSAFEHAHPVFAMLHLKGDTPARRLDIARREIDTLWEGGVDAVIVENYFGEREDVFAVCDYLCSEAKDVTFGVNVLEDEWHALSLANEFGASFVQLDSVAGHLAAERDRVFAARLEEERTAVDSYVLGGVRFKYQPYLSGRSLEDDLMRGVARCDGIVVTGEGTGHETPLRKLENFRRIVGATVPLIVGAGVTPQNCAEQLAVADAVIVGSYIKDTGTAAGDVDRDRVREFVRAVGALDGRSQ